MLTDWNENTARLTGTVMGEPEFSHCNHSEDFFRLPLRSLRLSGAADQVNVLLPRPLLEGVHSGARLTVDGAVRSWNNRTGVGPRLVITLLGKAVTAAEEAPDDNRVTLSGVLCRTPTFRRTPLGREISDLLLAVNRRYGRADYLPCIAWGSLAQYCAALDVGDGIRLQGRLQSRDYTKLTESGPERRTAFEVSVMTLETVGE